MAILNVQYTIPAGGVGQVTTTRTPARQLVISNSTAHTCRYGDATTSSTKGCQLAAGASVVLGNICVADLDLQNFYVAGTAADKIDFLVII